MQKLCAGQSVNNAGFLLAVLMSEGLVRPSTSKRRATSARMKLRSMLRSTRGSRLPMATAKSAPKKRRGKSAGVSKKGRAGTSNQRRSTGSGAKQRAGCTEEQAVGCIARHSASSDGQHSVVHRDGVAEEDGEARTAQAEWEAVRLNRARSSVGVPVRWSPGDRRMRKSKKRKQGSRIRRGAHAQCRPNTDPPESRCRSTTSGEQLYT